MTAMGEPAYFDETAVCPKCRGENIVTNYKPNAHAWSCRYHARHPGCCTFEHVDRTCRRCGYSWAELPDDAPRVTPKTSGEKLGGAEDCAVCGRCGQPPRGFAQINEVRYCHDDSQRPSCYELASWAYQRNPRERKSRES
jgi:hypothetical protein